MVNVNALDNVTIESLIYEIRGQKVMLDYQLAALFIRSRDKESEKGSKSQSESIS